MFDIGPLVGEHVRLEPMTTSHVDALAAAGMEPALWQWTPEQIRTHDDMQRYVDAALADKAAETAYPFVTVERATDTIVGSTRFANIVPAHRRLEIGWTWIAPAWQRSAVNTEAKFLMLREAFERLRYHRVEIKTDALNSQSRAAIERLGATFEGLFRKHVVCANGRVRDTAWYSIIDSEWPAIKPVLQRKLARDHGS
jgi:RimJ/RimL family protein N-acetyltransferase